MVNKVDLSEETAFVKVIRPLFSAAKIRQNALLTFFFGFHSMQSLLRRLQQTRSFNLEPFHVCLKWKPSLEIAFGWIEDYGHNRQVLLHLQLRGLLMLIFKSITLLILAVNSSLLPQHV